MGYASLQNQITRATKIKNVMIALTAAFGDEEFTRKQAEAILRGSGVSFDAIVKHNGVSKSREETFTTTVRNYDYYISSDEFVDIDVKRFYYVLTPARLKLIDRDRLEHEKALAIAKLNKKIAELNAQIALLESL